MPLKLDPFEARPLIAAGALLLVAVALGGCIGCPSCPQHTEPVRAPWGR